MKMIKSVTAVFAALIMCTGCGNPLVQHTEIEPPEKFEHYENIISETSPDFEPDSDWYRQFCQELRNYNTNVTIDKKIDKKTVRSMLVQLQNDCPDVFWLDGYYYKPNGQKTGIEFVLLDGCEKENIESMHIELEAAADNIVSLIPEGSSDYEKILFVHDYIVNHTVYDTAGAHEKSNGMWGNAYGCLVEGKAVCQGYAEGFEYVMQKLGIECGVGGGSSYRTVSHAWNYVRLDDKYYWIDVTWDDSDDGSIDEADHTYFLFNDEMMLRTRYLDDEQAFVPECSSLDMNWFVKNDAYFTEYNSRVLDYIKNQSGSCEFMFSSPEVYEEALNGLFGDGDIWEVTDMGLMGEISYIRNDRMYVIEVGY